MSAQEDQLSRGLSQLTKLLSGDLHDRMQLYAARLAGDRGRGSALSMNAARLAARLRQELLALLHRTAMAIRSMDDIAKETSVLRIGEWCTLLESLNACKAPAGNNRKERKRQLANTKNVVKGLEQQAHLLRTIHFKESALHDEQQNLRLLRSTMRDLALRAAALPTDAAQMPLVVRAGARYQQQAQESERTVRMMQADIEDYSGRLAILQQQNRFAASLTTAGATIIGDDQLYDAAESIAESQELLQARLQTSRNVKVGIAEMAAGVSGDERAFMDYVEATRKSVSIPVKAEPVPVVVNHQISTPVAGTMKKEVTL